MTPTLSASLHAFIGKPVAESQLVLALRSFVPQQRSNLSASQVICEIQDGLSTLHSAQRCTFKRLPACSYEPNKYMDIQGSVSLQRCTFKRPCTSWVCMRNRRQIDKMCIHLKAYIKIFAYKYIHVYMSYVRPHGLAGTREQLSRAQSHANP